MGNAMIKQNLKNQIDIDKLHSEILKETNKLLNKYKTFLDKDICRKIHSVSFNKIMKIDERLPLNSIKN